MTVYLNFRLQRAGISTLRRVYLHPVEEDWIPLDLEAEIRALFPGVKILDPKLGSPCGCELAIMVYRFPIHGFSTILGDIRKILIFSPDYFGFFELQKRHFDIVPKPSVASYVVKMVIVNTVQKILRILRVFKRLIVNSNARREIP